MEQVEQTTHFPIIIWNTQTKGLRLCNTPQDTPHGVPFIILETNAERLTVEIWREYFTEHSIAEYMKTKKD